MEIYLAICPFTERMQVYNSLEEASRDCIKRNGEHPRHPSYRLIRIKNGKAQHIGNLHRGFGRDFDPKNCWADESLFF